MVNRERRKVRKWLEANRLALIVDKTNFVIFHSQQRKLTDHIVLNIGNKKIKQESYVKFLGVLLDSNLSWKFHLAELSKKLARTAGLFFKIRHHAPTKTLILEFLHHFYLMVCQCGAQHTHHTARSHHCARKENTENNYIQ